MFEIQKLKNSRYCQNGRLEWGIIHEYVKLWGHIFDFYTGYSLVNKHVLMSNIQSFIENWHLALRFRQFRHLREYHHRRHGCLHEGQVLVK